MSEEATTPQQAEDILINESINVVPKELEDKTGDIISSMFADREIPFDVSHLSALIEGLRFSLSVLPEEKMQEFTMFILSVLKVRETVKQNGRAAN